MVIGMEMGLPGKSAKELEITALLHDIGKIGVSETVLRKAGKLDDSEFAEIKKHPGIGAEILSSIKQLSTSIMGVRHHQERFDGRGYPSGLKGRGIPLFGRIIAVADTFDAMTSNRPYRDRLSDETALAEIKRCSGTQFDPACVEAFISGYTKGLVKSS
jgi:HD-GYP domain-containing protein (c-di-GMP phosphodiesterase class II)